MRLIIFRKINIQLCALRFLLFLKGKFPVPRIPRFFSPTFIACIAHKLENFQTVIIFYFTFKQLFDFFIPTFNVCIAHKLENFQIFIIFITFKQFFNKRYTFSPLS